MNSQAVISLPRQCFYLLLHLTGLVCGLWMVHDPFFTLGMLLLVPASFLLSRLPMKLLPAVVRQILQLGYGLAGAFWLQKYLPDKAVSLLVVEFGCIVFPALYLLRSRREHNIMLFGIMGLVFYGSLHPNRSVFLPSFLIALLLFVLLLYCTRISFLGLKSESGQQIVSPDRKYRGTPGYRICHFVCTFMLTLFCISQFSLTRRMHTAGLIPGEWKVQQELKFPGFWEDWSAPLGRYLPGMDGRPVRSTAQELPPVLTEDRKAGLLVPGQSTDALQMNGSGAGMGDRLVFRAVTPARMYWMVQAYDTYDGNQWTRSEIMKKGRSGLDTFEPKEYYTLAQNIVMENPAGRNLPYVYRPVRLTWLDEFRESGSEEEAGAPLGGVIRHRDHILYELLNQTMPPLPWRYSVFSRLPNPALDGRKLELTNPGNRNLGWNYLQLPRTKISPRLRRLARSLTGNTDDRMEKATILRDYLKNHFQYNLTPGQIPKDAEICDYFLFESREGYCQHFAQALTVLARLAGLPARLVVGYSPGNYNFMADCFEVYEYHGHAWTQIFIEPYGWLTFDGTPPGAIPDMAGPKILQRLLDPFGERKDSRPPEISFLPQGEAVSPEAERLAAEAPAEQVQALTLAGVQEKAVKVYEKIYSEAAKAHPDHAPGLKDLLQTGGNMLREKARQAWTQIREAAVRWKNAWKKFLQRKSRELSAWLKQLSLWDWGCFLAAAAVLGRLLAERRRLIRSAGTLWRKWNSRRLWRKLQEGRFQDRQMVEICQKLVYGWMEDRGIRRLPSQDVFEYGENLRRKMPAAAADYSLLAQAAAKAWYGNVAPPPELCRQAMQATERLKRVLGCASDA